MIVGICLIIIIFLFFFVCVCALAASTDVIIKFIRYSISEN